MGRSLYALVIVWARSIADVSALSSVGWQKLCTTHGQNCISSSHKYRRQNNSIIPYKHTRIRSIELYMAPPTSTDEDLVKDDKKEKNPIKQTFNSLVRSTTQTDTIVKQVQSTTNEEEEDSQLEIPQEVLQPFALLLLSQFILFVGVGAVIPTIPLYGQSIGLSSAANGVVISAPAVALLLISRVAGEYSDKGRKKVMLGGMAL